MLLRLSVALEDSIFGCERLGKARSPGRCFIALEVLYVFGESCCCCVMTIQAHHWFQARWTGIQAYDGVEILRAWNVLTFQRSCCYSSPAGALFVCVKVARDRD